MGRERDGERADGGWLRGEERGEEREVGGRGDDGEAEAARGEEGGQVEERQRVALRGEGDDEHVRPGVGAAAVSMAERLRPESGGAGWPLAKGAVIRRYKRPSHQPSSRV